MSVLDQIAFYKDRRDEVPNQQLALKLSQTEDLAGIREIASNLWNSNPQVQSDCLKVLYEIGYRNPQLVAPYVDDFIKLLDSSNNRLVWGAMIALSTIAEIQAERIYTHRQLIQEVTARGSVITRDNGIKVLSRIAHGSPERTLDIFPFLLHHLQTCRSKDVPQHSEAILVAVGPSNQSGFIETLNNRLPELHGAQLNRVQKVIKSAAASQSG
jgi:hypothetical protein